MIAVWLPDRTLVVEPLKVENDSDANSYPLKVFPQRRAGLVKPPPVPLPLFSQWPETFATMNTASPPKPKNRPLDLSRCRSFGISLLLTAFAMGVCEAAETIQTTGVLGSPSATTTIDGKQLPPPDPKFGGVIKEKAVGLETVVAAARRAAQGRAQCAAHHDRRLRVRRAEHVRRRHPDAGPGSHREGGAAVHAVPFHVAVLADARGADHRTQPSRRPALASWAKRRRGSRATTRSSGRIAARSATILKENGYATSWFGKDHNTPFYQASQAGPFDQWPIGMGFEYFYGFVGGDTSQWQPNLFRNTTAIYPFQGNPGWNLTTAMADDAIQYMKQLNEIAPDKPFFVYYVPGGTHSPHHPTPEWIKKISDMHLFDDGWNKLRETIFANQKRLGIIPPTRS